MRNRLQDLLKIKDDSQVTSFPDETAAQRAVDEVLKGNARDINKWFKDAKIGDKESFQVKDLGRETGYGIGKNEFNLTPRHGARVVLRKVGDKVWKIITSYPI